MVARGTCPVPPGGDGVTKATVTLEIPLQPIVDALRLALQGLVPAATAQVTASVVRPASGPMGAPTAEDVARRLLLELGCPPGVKGYHYIGAAVDLLLSDRQQPITKELYPSIARRYKTQPSRVERAIRHAITVMDSRGDSARLREICGHELTNSHALRAFADHVAAILATG